MAVADDEPGFTSIFDGKTLKGWDGDTKFWSVQNGAIQGKTTPDNPTKGNTFLIWRGGEPDDFELRLQFRIQGGNSGIQYRSRETKKWVIGGYQADFDAMNEWTGTLYDELGRGVLARRGARVVVHKDGTKEVTGQTATEEEILRSTKKEDWNDYTVIAEGEHLRQIINGITTVDVMDHQESERDLSGLLALQVHSGPPMTVEFRNIRLKRLGKKDASRAKKVVFLAGRPSHGYGSHEHFAGCVLLARALEAGMPQIGVEIHREFWPGDLNALNDADALVMYCDGGSGHPVHQHLEEIGQLAKKGTGIVCIHYAVEVPRGESGRRFLDWIGGYFEPHWSVNPHWEARFAELPEHPITRGVEPFQIQDEWYYHMRFRDNMDGVTPILTDLPPPETLQRPDGPHSGNPDVRAAIARGEPQHVAWAVERTDGGRGFGFTGGHFHWNWGDNNFRKLVLNAIAWTAKAEVPAGGVSDHPLSLEQLEANQDEQPPADFDRAAVRQRLKSSLAP
jgi:hypothetical protein